MTDDGGAVTRRPGRAAATLGELPLLVAGVDLGNTTTEIAIGALTPSGAEPVVWDRRPTRGLKGSPESFAGAARLLLSMEHRLGRPVDRVLLTPQRPVLATVTEQVVAAAGIGPLWCETRGSGTRGNVGVAVGVPMRVDGDPVAPAGPVVLVATDPLGYRATVAGVSRWLAAGADVTGVVLAGDEARLVSRRVAGWYGPVLDDSDAERVLACRRVALEVPADGSRVRRISDAVWLGSVLGVADTEAVRLGTVALRLRGATSGIVGVLSAPHAEAVRDEAVRDEAARDQAAGEPVTVDGDPSGRNSRCWRVDLARVVPSHLAQVRTDAVLSAELEAGEPASDAGFEELARAIFGPRARVLATEPSAALRGAATTPGVLAGSPPAVLDLGGGTIDLVAGEVELVAAGAGALLTAAVALSLRIGRGSAEWAKRGPCLRVESPFVAADELGVRHFLERPAATGSVGWLTVEGPAGPLPFSSDIGPGDWRALRSALKRAVLADNVARLVELLPQGALGSDLLLVGGPAGDDEVLDTLGELLPGTRLGRADVAGVMSHRWAVAWGLVVLAV